MKQISVFDLQRNIGKALEELPFQITKYGKVIAVVNRYNVTLNEDNVTLNISATKPIGIPDKTEVQWEEVEMHRCEWPNGCKRTAEGKTTVTGWDDILGEEKTKDLYLCKFHQLKVEVK